MELSALPFRSDGNLPRKKGGEGIIKLCGKIKRLLFRFTTFYYIGFAKVLISVHIENNCKSICVCQSFPIRYEIASFGFLDCSARCYDFILYAVY